MQNGRDALPLVGDVWSVISNIMHQVVYYLKTKLLRPLGGHLIVR